MVQHLFYAINVIRENRVNSIENLIKTLSSMKAIEYRRKLLARPLTRHACNQDTGFENILLYQKFLCFISSRFFHSSIMEIEFFFHTKIEVLIFKSIALYGGNVKIVFVYSIKK